MFRFVKVIEVWVSVIYHEMLSLPRCVGGVNESKSRIFRGLSFERRIFKYTLVITTDSCCLDEPS